MRRLARLIVALRAASLTAACWEPLYGTHAGQYAESVQDKFSAVEIPPIVVPKGSPDERVAVGMFNALQFDLHTGAGAAKAPIYQLVVTARSGSFNAVISSISGRPDAAVGSVTASYQLVEIATGKTVVKETTTAEVDYDVPGSQQRFAE